MLEAQTRHRGLLQLGCQDIPSHLGGKRERGFMRGRFALGPRVKRGGKEGQAVHSLQGVRLERMVWRKTKLRAQSHSRGLLRSEYRGT
jgi:hypothetical protein